MKGNGDGEPLDKRSSSKSGFSSFKVSRVCLMPVGGETLRSTVEEKTDNKLTTLQFNKWKFALGKNRLILVYRLYTQYFPELCEKSQTYYSRGIWTHDLCNYRSMSYQPSSYFPNVSGFFFCTECWYVSVRKFIRQWAPHFILFHLFIPVVKPTVLAKNPMERKTMKEV